MSRVFISYRRDDSAHVTGRIFDCLRQHFGRQELFRDVDHIPYGRDFRTVIQDAVEGCEVMLVVIGPSWLEARDEQGMKRLDQANDFVRLEIEAALGRGITIVPLFIAPARAPEAAHLPASLRQLVYFHGPEIRRDPDFHSDMNRLITVLTELLGDEATGESTAIPRVDAEPALRPKRARAAGMQDETMCPSCSRPGSLVPWTEEGSHANTEALVWCKQCGFRIRKEYLGQPQLRLPVIGVRGAGTTTMLVSAYDRFRKRTAPTAASIRPIRAKTDGMKRMDMWTESYFEHRTEIGATGLVRPDPLLLQLRDASPHSANTALVHLCDYPGEILNPDCDSNQLKETAARMDGFVLLFDPTQLYGDGANLSLDEQLRMIDEYLEFVRHERGLFVQDHIPLPVAVCIPKFDLLLTDNPIGGQSVEFIRRLTNELAPEPEGTTLELLNERSELVEQMLPLMFTGVNIRGLLEGHFGKRLMFFPVSSVGLYESELGEKDLKKRIINPFGVTEPFIWLLHMHGYEMFAAD